MNLQLIDYIFNGVKDNTLVQNFINELQEYLEKNSLTNKVEDFKMEQNEEKLTTEYRDKLHIKQNEILVNYAKETERKGQMYYIYSRFYILA